MGNVDYMYLVVPDQGVVTQVIKVYIPEGMSDVDLYIQLIADIPAHEPQPILLGERKRKLLEAAL